MVDLTKWLLKKFFKPETLAEAAVEAGVERLNNEIKKRGIEPVVQKVAAFGKALAEGTAMFCSYLASGGTIDATEKAEIKAFIVPKCVNAVNKVLN